MPQYPYSYNSGGTNTALNLTAGTTIVKASPGRVMRIVVNTAMTVTPLAVNDAATSGAVAAANLIFTSPIATAVAGTVYTLEAVCNNGIAVTVGTGGVVSVFYS